MNGSERGGGSLIERIFSILLVIMPVMQLVQGCSIDFALLSLVFNLATIMAVATLGGLTTAGGLIIAIVAAKSPLIGHLIKLAMWESPEAGLATPVATMRVLAAGMTLAACGVAGARLVVPRLELLRPQLSTSGLKRVWIAMIALTVLRVNSGNLGLPGFIISALSYTPFAPNLAVIAITARCRLMATKGGAIDRWTGVTLFGLFVNAFSIGSKQGMLEVAAAFVVTSLAFGYRPKRRDIFIGATFGILFHFVIYPIAQSRSTFGGEGSIAARLERAASVGEKLMSANGDISQELLSSLSAAEIEDLIARRQGRNLHFRYFGFEPLFLERIVLHPISAQLVEAVENEGPLGWEEAIGTVTLIPKELSGIASTGNLSNILGRKSRVLAPNDFKTGISFGPFVENYALGDGVDFALLTGVSYFVFGAVLLLFANHLVANVWAVGLLFLLQHDLTETSSVTIILALTRTIPVFVATYLIFGRERRALGNFVPPQNLPIRDFGSPRPLPSSES